MEIVEYMQVNIRCILIAPALIPPQILERKESISPSSFYGKLQDY